MSEDEHVPSPRVRVILSAESRPMLAPHVHLRFDDLRKHWVLLAPERMMSPSETAVSVLQLCNGTRTIDEIATVLALEYDAPKPQILTDILSVLQDMADKRHLV